MDDMFVLLGRHHLRRLEVVLNCFKRAGLKLNPGKCSFRASNINILGHQVNKDGIRPDDDKIKAVSQFPIPKNLQQLRIFLGLSSYYRRFIKNYANIARPLNSLLSKGIKFQWNTDQERAFQKLKNALTSKDASGYGKGAVLAQKQGNGEKVIAYASRTLLKSEKNYSTMERECLAIIWAIGKFRPYLFGRPFKVRGRAQEIAKFLLEEVILKHGAPREIVMDRGRNFQSRLIQELTKNCHIKKKTTTAYHPQTNGLTERLNRTIADMLSMYMDLDQKNWDEMLPFITFAYNTTRQDSTGFSPFFLVHGREAEMTLDTIFPYSSASEGEEFIQLVASRAEEARQIARHHIFKAQETNKLNNDARHKGKVYQPGDLVWIFTPIRRVGLSEKLLKRYFGPYKVIKKISDVTYEVEAFGKSDKRQKGRDTVHILRMKPYFGPSRQEDSSMAEISWVPKDEERSIRRSRRLQGLTPDNTATMNNRSEATTQVSPLFCQNVVRNPSMFSGEISEDPQAWLKCYERVARHNHWDDSPSLANKDNLRRQAEQKLKVRAQTRGETTEFYIQDVLRLCREVDAQMPEEERLSHLMKGVAEEVYRYLLPRYIATTDQFIAECRRVRLPNVTSLGDLGDVTDLQSLIRQIVREEVLRALAPPREEQRISSLEEIVKEEVDKVLAPMSGINTFPMESAARSAPRNYRKNTWYAPKTRKFPWSQCYKTFQPVSSAFTIGKLRAALSNGGGAAAQPIIPLLSTVVKMTNKYIDIKIEGDTIRALVDSRASYSVISELFRVELKKTMFAETDVVLKVADDKVVKSKGRCTLKLEVNGHPENFEFVVLENCSHDVILGWDFFKATNAVIDCGLGELQLDDLPDLDAEGRDDGVYAIQDFVIPGRSSQRISVVNRSLVGIVNMEVTCSKELFIRKDKGMNLGRICDIETEHVCLLSVKPESFSRERREDDHSDYLLSLINPDLP
ncbi:hypothetical protein LAZ67_8001124 [Cordylochernes scorpioides]|uniref:RNA-directed DNA polymerase n=1 Tax=Cordylochernes scorpioides TaxID=51811 RepID=A0ABY6KTK5_9ARAC|nr:hypothetical protein LAZ67_8001124 [Cordylochernes scorpioides]